MTQIYSYPYNIEDYSPSMPVVEVGIRPHRKSATEVFTVAALDTGSDATLIPAQILHQIGAEYVRQGYLRGISGQRQSVKLYNASIRVGSIILSGITAVATTNNEEILLGRDVLNQIIVTLNGLASVTEIQA